MANPLKQLAGETAIYGLSTILARVINFLFVPFYTRLLTTESYGVVTEFMAYIAVLQVALVLGLETGCFRFANKDGVNPDSVYSNALSAVFGVSAAFLAAMIVFAGSIASALGYGGYESCIMYMGGILFLDSVTAIFFARLRQGLIKPRTNWTAFWSKNISVCSWQEVSRSFVRTSSSSRSETLIAQSALKKQA